MGLNAVVLLRMPETTLVVKGQAENGSKIVESKKLFHIGSDSREILHIGSTFKPMERTTHTKVKSLP